jgi:hypothetical protein
MFVRDPFDIAPRASRHTRAGWFTLALGLLFMLLCLYLLGRGVQAWNQAEATSRTQRQLLRVQAEKEAASRRMNSDPAALERIRAEQKLQQMLRMSWAGLFDALEASGKEVGGRATVLSLAPLKTQADAAEVGITALAVSNQVMVDYIRALEKDPHIREVQLSMHQPSLSAGVEVVRFQLSVLWDPLGTGRAGLSK